jgi:hypothetical protein
MAHVQFPGAIAQHHIRVLNSGLEIADENNFELPKQN